MLNIKFAIPFLLAVLLIPVGMSFAQTTPGEEDHTDEIRPVGNANTSYTIHEIERSFGVMEHYVIYDENKNITYDLQTAREDGVLELDIVIALDFASINNEFFFYHV